MKRAFFAGGLYFAIVFAAGFVLGAIRTTLIAPRLGEVGAVLLELPFMLAVSWIACGDIIRGLKVRVGAADRAVMGAAAFALLMAAELGLAIVAFNEAPGEWAARLFSPAGLLGLAGQIAFAAMPLMRR